MKEKMAEKQKRTKPVASLDLKIVPVITIMNTKREVKLRTCSIANEKDRMACVRFKMLLE